VKLWKVTRSDNYLGPLAELSVSDGEYALTVADGAEGAHITLSAEELLDLAFKIYEELG
jgi:hypothetical protein